MEDLQNDDMISVTDDVHPCNRSNANVSSGSLGHHAKNVFHVFEMQKRNARDMYPILRALAFMDYCTMVATIDGIKLTIDDRYHQLVNVYFHYDQFAMFSVRSTTTLRFPLKIFMEVLNVFSGNTTSLRMHYDGEGQDLVVCVEDEGIVFSCSIATENPLPDMEFNFDSVPAMCKVILRPECMRDVVRELDSSAQVISLIVTKGYISFLTSGDLGKIKTEIPSSSEQVELLECLADRVSHSYKISLIRRVLGCFAICDKVSLRINQDGVLCFQFLIPQTEEQHHFVEIYCVADTDEFFR